MNLFTNKKADYTVIVGCGHLGSSIANSLFDEGGNVLVIDRDKDSFRKLPLSYWGLTTLIGDATDIDVLHEAQVEKATAIVVATGNDNTNIMIAQIAKERFKKECVIAGLYEPERECVYREFGIDTVSPALLFTKEICNRLNSIKKEAIV